MICKKYWYIKVFLLIKILCLNSPSIVFSEDHGKISPKKILEHVEEKYKKREKAPIKG